MSGGGDKRQPTCQQTRSIVISTAKNDAKIVNKQARLEALARNYDRAYFETPKQRVFGRNKCKSAVTACQKPLPLPAGEVSALTEGSHVNSWIHCRCLKTILKHEQFDLESDI